MKMPLCLPQNIFYADSYLNKKAFLKFMLELENIKIHIIRHDFGKFEGNRIIINKVIVGRNCLCCVYLLYTKAT